MSINHALVIDDSKATQAICGHLLKKLEADVVFASNSDDAWALITKNDTVFDIIVISRQSYSSDLFEFASRLRHLISYVSVPLILMTKGKLNQGTHNLYKAGFTQVFSFTQTHLLVNYLEQTQQRNTFKKEHQNKVIIIEDDHAQQEIVKQILEGKHCECYTFFSAEHALEHVEAIEPHIIICDFFLDDAMTGLDFVLHTKQSDHPWSQVPILIMSGFDDPTRRYELVRSGANDYISKPIDELDLSVRVENLIRYKHLLDTVESQRRDMQELALRDQLTGLYNRHFIAEHVRIRIIEAQREKVSYSLVVVDIDFFKKINDQYGHHKGDLVIQNVASLLQQHIRGNDVAARIGGEEFLLLLSHCDLPQAVRKAEVLRKALESTPIEELSVTASFGVAQLGPNDDCFDTLFKAADQALYSAKENGRNRVEQHTDTL